MTPRLLAPALLACLLVAGCSDPRADSSAGGGASLDGMDDPAEAPRRGTVTGLVVDESSLPVAGADVSLLGTERVATADVNGTFIMEGVEPGEYTLRVGSAPHRAHEGRIQVKAGQATQVTITLVPANDRGPGYRPHLHDYWGTDTEIVLIDEAVDWTKSPPYGSGSSLSPAGPVLMGVWQANSDTWVAVDIPQRGDGRPATVLPGTAQVRFKVAWDPGEVRADGFRLSYMTAKREAYVTMDPLANGAQATVALGDGDADNGHQSFSLWQFRLQPTRGALPNAILGPIQVTVTLVKGAVPVEPSHEDFWADGTERLVRNFNVTFQPSVTTVGSCGETNSNMSPDTDTIVPPGTGRLRMRLAWASIDAAVAAGGAEGTFRLRWKSADLPPAAPVTDYQTAPSTPAGKNTITYDIAIEPSQTDAFYQTRSNWKFNADRTDLPQPCAYSYETRYRFNLEVVAVKDPGFP